ncbi:MAG: putative RNA methyltransferase [Vicinamibacterales bacterium]
MDARAPTPTPSTPLPLSCTVRACGQPLTRRGRAYVCPRGHSFDVARRGYVNLLQPQDRKSREPGDARVAVEARAGLLAAGIGRAVVDELVRRVAAMDLLPGAVVVDLGSGTGDALGALAAARPITGIGIDLSIAAAEHAARRFPELTWVVANADRRLPIVDRGADVVLSLHGRRNPAECARVLKAGGLLVLVVPAPGDLVELRELVQGARVERDRVETVLASHAPFFALRDRFTARESHRLEHADLVALLRATYRGARASAAARVESLTALEVTFASDVLVLTLAAPETHA